MLKDHRWRAALAFVLLFLLYQGAEGVGARLLDNVAVQAGFMLAMVAIGWPVGRWLGFRGYDAYALDWQRSTPVLLAGGLALALLVKYVAVCIGMAFDVYVAQAPAVPSVASVSFLSSIPWALVATFVPSIAEDILTRGFLYRALRVRWVPWVFVLSSSVLYVLNHIYRLSAGPAEWIMLFCFGLAYATAVVRTGSLWLAVGLHWGWNLANVLVGDILPYQVVSPVWSSLLSAGAHLVVLGLLFAVPLQLEREGLRPGPA
ncbi:CPBP family intramembrane glutamic endopeptidase [Luteibacter yeojuensis]|uniref:CPBP family intramembrane metalloprotease n=1 Tax=Luteibacter yeojuensis TaxID=345309 RepID=A0A7X5QX51_9GAMM|nr:CPBP family intramembrane glutamic endopeptidase [Luteibacter yeojuensis]NID16986.1 CPBP family intramembrane metalloprotease [Luteibacter yeojuensis]